MVSNIFSYIWKHKIYFLIGLVILGGGGYWIYGKYFSTQTTVRYSTTKAALGDITTTLTGVGQVSASSEVSIKAKAGGEITVLNMKEGQTVKAGTLLAVIDPTDALKTVRDAKSSLETAQLSYDKVMKPATELTITQAENSLYQAKASLVKNQDALSKAYENSYNDTADAFLDLADVMTGIQNLLYKGDFSDSLSNIDWYANRGVTFKVEDYNKILEYRTRVNDYYQKARAAYDANLEVYKSSSRNSDNAAVESLTAQTYETVKALSEVIKNSLSYIDFVKDHVDTYNQSLTTAQTTLINNQRTSLNSYTSKVNSHLSTLLSDKQTITDTKNTIVSTEQSIQEKTLSLADLKTGPETLDIRSAEISVQKAKDSLVEAQNQLANYYVRAPFDGVIADVTISKGDTVSSGGAVATIITPQKIATITLSETDVAQVKEGQKVSLTFDAIDGLEISGTVAQVDTIGTVSQGVVSYGIKMNFDSQDDRVKSGMTVNASIIVASKTQVILVPAAAVKTQDDITYLEIMDDSGMPYKKQVIAGITDDVSVEITNGLSVGEEVVTQTITDSASKTTTKSSSSNRNSMGGVGAVMGGPPM